MNEHICCMLIDTTNKSYEQEDSIMKKCLIGIAC